MDTPLILLVEIENAPEMQPVPSPNLSTWAWTGSNIKASNSNRTVEATANSGGTAIANAVCSTLNPTYWEIVIDQVASGASRNAAVGMIINGVHTNNYLGIDANSWGWWSDGAIICNASIVATTVGFASGDVLGIYYDPYAGGSFKLYKNGIVIYAQGFTFNTANATLNPACCPWVFNSTTDRGKLTLRGLVYQYDFYPSSQPLDLSGGFFPPAITTITLATQNYLTASGSSPLSGTIYEGRVRDEVVYERSVACILWNNSGTASQQSSVSGVPSYSTQSTVPISDIEIDNTDHALDYFIGLAYRDCAVRFYLVAANQPGTSATQIGSALIDHIEAKDEHTLRIVLRDKLAQLDRPIQQETYDTSASNATLFGQPRPLAMGAIQYAPLEMFDTANLDYELAKSASVPNTVIPGCYVSALRDQGVLITPGTGWAYTKGTLYGVRRLTNPAGKLAASIAGVLSLGTALDSGDTFNTWAGTPSVPVGWIAITTQNANDKFVRGAGNVGLNIVNSGGSYQDLRLSASSLNGYGWIEFDVLSVTTPGIVSPYSSGYFQIYIGQPGHYRVPIFGANNSVGLSTSTAVNITITNFSCWPATLINQVQGWLDYLLGPFGGYARNHDFDYSGTFASLQTAAPYALCYYAGSSDKTNYVDLTQRTMDSFCGWYWADRNGLIKIGRLVDPASLTASLNLTDNEIIGDIVPEPDLAQGLSDTIQAVPNFCVHTEQDIAGTLWATAHDATNGNDRNTAAALMADYGATLRTTKTLARCYQGAIGAAPLQTLLSNPADAQTEIDRICAMYSVPRNFYKLQCVLDANTAYTVEPGQAVNVTSSAFGLSNGKNLLVVSAKGKLGTRLLELQLWG